jgi:hypothetical protein
MSADRRLQSPPASAPAQPSGWGEQVPVRPLTLQDMHGPLQAVSQQIWATQKPDAQSAFCAQGGVPVFTWHRPVVSQYVPVQSASVTQLVRQPRATGSHV